MIRHDEFDWEKDYQAVSLPALIEYRGPGYWHPDDALIIPMWSTQKKPLGVLWVDEPVDDRIPGLETIRLLELLANQGAIALENAQLHKQIRQDAETKATLLREVNHRVQNNLTAIIGMINFEQTRPELKDQPDYRAIMHNLSNRIWGMAIAHRMLSGTSWSPVLLSDLATRIIASVVRTQSSNKRFSVDIPPSSILVSAKYASSLALIINELTTNTVKYALNDRSAGRITVKIDYEDDAILFEYQDDGPGYPVNVLQSRRYNVGLQLVRGITESDLAGELSLRNDDGAVSTIRFTPDNHNFA
jgi:two-component sensor histidine kinase